MKKIPVFLLILGMLLSLACPAWAEPGQNSQAISCHGLQAKLSLAGAEKKLETADAVILYELNTDTMVYSWNPDALLDPTGMVKFLTALVALENGDLDEEVTVTRKALDSVVIGAVSAELKRGEVLTLRQLLYCVMVASANDACAVIAEHVGGTQENFVAMMNAKAKELGCVASTFTNPHGLPDANQISTARDLAVITKAALENPEFRTLFEAKEYEVPATNKTEEPRQLHTTNHMMSTATLKNHMDERVTGGKPASASTTDRSLICTAQVGGSRYLSVVMSAEAVLEENGSVKSFGNFEETKALLDFGFQNYSVRQVIDDGQIFGQYPVADGENDVIVQPSQDLYTVLPDQYDPQYLVFSEQVDAKLLAAPLEKGAVLGTVQISYGTITLGFCDLVAMHDVDLKGSTIRPAAPAAPEEEAEVFDWSFLIWIGVGIVGLALLALIVFLVIRLLRSARIRRAHRRRMRQRRRSR